MTLAVEIVITMVCTVCMIPISGGGGAFSEE